jgi:3-(3-hydroxy-phenyl)propionate hydroxylase
MTEHEVVVAGAGPTGLMLAGELALAGIDVVVVERRADQQLDGSRAGGLFARTLEVLDQRGIAERFVEAGQIHPAQMFAGAPLDVRDLPTRHNYVLALWQKDFEPILAGWVEELGVPILRRREVLGFTQDDTGVDLELSGAASVRAQYLVGCDGGRSVIRKGAGIDFAGLEPSTSWLIAEVEMDGEPEFGMRHDRVGSHGLNRTGDQGPIRVLITEPTLERADDPSLTELREAIVGVYGTDYGLRGASWISRFTDAARQAASYRAGRVLLAGDAAHIHSPHGGQGLNTGVQDAVNLGWKLAQVVNEMSPESLLDTYHAERHPIGARVLQNTMAAVALSLPDERHEAVRDIFGELLRMEEPRIHMVAMLSGLDIRYDLGDAHPILGRRMPDLDVQTSDGPTRVFELLHEARPLLLNFGTPASHSDHVRSVDASFDGAWVLPVLGEVASPSAVLIRPDGYVAWAGDLDDPALPVARSTWFGSR